MRDRSVSMEDGGTRSGKREIGAILGCDLGEVEGVIWALGSLAKSKGAIRSRSRSCILLSSKNDEVEGCEVEGLWALGSWCDLSAISLSLCV